MRKKPADESNGLGENDNTNIKKKEKGKRKKEKGKGSFQAPILSCGATVVILDT